MAWACICAAFIGTRLSSIARTDKIGHCSFGKRGNYLAKELMPKLIELYSGHSFNQIFLDETIGPIFFISREKIIHCGRRVL
mmetsp:Transcript_31251/g.47454  ORF Transcript_31251/g.47454 Transcript_31251/m.47454 type:complete len:82 (-) Transcript_31251:162-407(-)